MTGLRSSKIRPLVIIGVIIIRYMILPAIGIWIVKVANHLGFLPADPLFSYVLMIQFALPPAMNIGKRLNHTECVIPILMHHKFGYYLRRQDPYRALLQ